VPKHVRIDFSGMAEPWANRFATDMLENALYEGATSRSTPRCKGMRDPETVASAARVRVASRGCRGPLARHARQHARVQGQRAVPKRRWRSFARLKGVRFMTMAESSVAGSADMKWRPITRAGNLDLQTIEGQDITLDPVYRTPVTCSFTPFYDQNVLLPNGDVVLCCMDYSIKHKLGNLLVDDYYDLFKSDAAWCAAR
jgi:hypothetical protein